MSLCDKLELVAAEPVAPSLAALAGVLGVAVLPPSSDQLGQRPYRLAYTDGRLELSENGTRGAVAIDFLGGKNAHRRQFGGGRGQPLARAMGLKRGKTPQILDATAGLGRDAFVLASLGCRLTLLERSPVVHALLADALSRASDDPEVGPIVKRMQLLSTDAGSYLTGRGVTQRPQVVYLDPMYPHRNKSALVKREMRLFRELVGDDPDSDALLDKARACALERVVVKRPKGAGHLDERVPDARVTSPNTRYDLYFTHGGSNP